MWRCIYAAKANKIYCQSDEQLVTIWSIAETSNAPVGQLCAKNKNRLEILNTQILNISGLYNRKALPNLLSASNLN
jgi:hypothetical protein